MSEDSQHGHPPRSGAPVRYVHDVKPSVQLNFLQSACWHPETTKADVAVLAEVVQRYWGKYGNGWVSHDRLIEKTGLSKASVVRAKANLERLGLIEVVQQGRRGSSTVYRPNFHRENQKGVTHEHETIGSIHEHEMCILGITDDTLSPRLGIKDDTPTFLRDRFTRTESQEEGHDFPAASPPLADGPLGAPAAGSGKGGFEELWRAYDYRKNKAAARQAFEKIDPDLHHLARLVSAAHAWRESWAAKADPNAPRRMLHSWLSREDFDCDPPSRERVKQKLAANNNTKTKPSTPQTEESPMATTDHSHDDDILPFIPTIGTVVQSEVYTEDGETTLKVDFDTDRGTRVATYITLESFSESAQVKGQRELSDLTHALGLQSIENPAELHGRQAMLFVSNASLVTAISKKPSGKVAA